MNVYERFLRELFGGERTIRSSLTVTRSADMSNGSVRL